jgi:putative oxidoreductase
MMAYGVSKFLHGADGKSTVETLTSIGKSMDYVGIHFGYLFFGFVSALTEVMGGFMILAGFLFRPAAALLAFNMLIATIFVTHQLDASQGKTFVQMAMHPLSLMGIFLGLLFAGPGKWSIQKH